MPRLPVLALGRADPASTGSLHPTGPTGASGPAAPDSSGRPRQPCAGAIVFDERNRLLLIRRGKPPAAGTWSLPGGRCHAAESADVACVREVAEETGLLVQVVRWVGRVERDAPDGGVYVIDDFLCRRVGGSLQAGDDADDALWADRRSLPSLPLAPGVVDALTRWSMLPR